jgi:hypothetical protein
MQLHTMSTRALNKHSQHGIEASDGTTARCGERIAPGFEVTRFPDRLRTTVTQAIGCLAHSLTQEVLT